MEKGSGDVFHVVEKNCLCLECRRGSFPPSAVLFSSHVFCAGYGDCVFMDVFVVVFAGLVLVSHGFTEKMGRFVGFYLVDIRPVVAESWSHHVSFLDNPWFRSMNSVCRLAA
jgi:hypothetical protein